MDMQKKYKVGMFGGCFDPIHNGHVSVIKRAADECEKLYIVVSYSPSRDWYGVSRRVGWIRRIVNQLGKDCDIQILKLKDECQSKSEYDCNYHWQKGAEWVKSSIGMKIDAVYCGSDYNRPDNQYARFYPESEIVIVDRNKLKAASSEIRKNVYDSDNWKLLPTIVQNDLVKRVLVIGNESVGKTTMVERLARWFGSSWKDESGREVCEACGGEANMQEEDFLKAILLQRIGIKAATGLSAEYGRNKVVFVDTDAITTGYYAGMNDNVPEDSFLRDFDALARISGRWDLIIFLESDVKYVGDGIRIDKRNEPNERMIRTEYLKNLYQENGFYFTVVSGSDYDERFKKCVKLVEGILK